MFQYKLVRRDYYHQLLATSPDKHKKVQKIERALKLWDLWLRFLLIAAISLVTGTAIYWWLQLPLVYKIASAVGIIIFSTLPIHLFWALEKRDDLEKGQRNEEYNTMLERHQQVMKAYTYARVPMTVPVATPQNEGDSPTP